jgi:hypothetical protein
VRFSSCFGRVMPGQRNRCVRLETVLVKPSKEAVTIMPLEDPAIIKPRPASRISTNEIALQPPGYMLQKVQEIAGENTDTADLDALKNAFENAWTQMRSDGPNNRRDPGPVRIVVYPGESEARSAGTARASAGFGPRPDRVVRGDERRDAADGRLCTRVRT